MRFSQLAAIAMVAFVSLINLGQAQEPPAHQEEMTNRAIRLGMDFLVKNQRKDGAIADRSIYVTGQTALSILALLIDGADQKENSSDGLALCRAITFLLHEKRINKSFAQQWVCSP